MPDDDAAPPAEIHSEAQAAFDALVEQRAIVEADWARAAEAGGLPYPRGKAWQARDLPEDAVLVDQAGKRYRRNAAGELRRIKGLHAEGDEQ